MATVALDADVLIGFLEPTDPQHERAVEALAPFLGSGHRVLVGASVYAEALVRPLRVGRPQIVDDFLEAARIPVSPITAEVARGAARLRADHPALRLPDALALASARAGDARLVTLDQRLKRIADSQA